MSAALGRLDLTLHHHIDTTFGSLSRLIIEKHDRIMDQMIRRIENMEDALDRGIKELKSEAVDLRKQIHHVQGDVRDIKKKSDRNVESIKGFDAKLEGLEKNIEEHACKCQHSTMEHSPSEPDSERHHYHRSESASQTSHRRTESAHATVGQGETQQGYRSGASRTSNGARVSRSGSKRNRSNTINSQPAASRTSDERGNRREYFTELGAARGPVPDLRDHPAFAESQQVQPQVYGYEHPQNHSSTILDGLPYQNPSLSDGKWYQQAYGQR